MTTSRAMLNACNLDINAPCDSVSSRDLLDSFLTSSELYSPPPRLTKPLSCLASSSSSPPTAPDLDFLFPCASSSSPLAQLDQSQPRPQCPPMHSLIDAIIDVSDVPDDDDESESLWEACAALQDPHLVFAKTHNNLVVHEQVWSRLGSFGVNGRTSLLASSPAPPWLPPVPRLASKRTCRDPPGPRVGFFQNALLHPITLVHRLDDVYLEEEHVTRSSTHFIHPHGLEHIVMFAFTAELQHLVDVYGRVLAAHSPGKDKRTLHLMTHDFATFESTFDAATVQTFLQEHFDKEYPNAISIYVHPRPCKVAGDLPRFGVFHPKLFLLFYPHGCRVIITSCNGENANGGLRAETQWTQDFPKFGANPPSNPERAGSSDFATVLFETVTSSFVDAPIAGCLIASKLSDVDFSSAEVDLILSRPVPNNQPWTKKRDIERYGLGRLETLLNRFCRETPENYLTCIQSSSFGSQGSDPHRPWILDGLGRAMCGGHVPSHVRVHVPTRKEVTDLVGISGIQASIVLNTGQLADAAQCPAVKLCRWTPPPRERKSRGMAEAHTKLFCRCDPNSNKLAWCVMGSHNATQAAWGAISRHNGTGAKGLRIWNWELSIFFCPRVYGAAGRHRFNIETCEWEQIFGDNVDLSQIEFVHEAQTEAFHVLLPLSFNVRAEEYGDDDEVWRLEHRVLLPTP